MRLACADGKITALEPLARPPDGLPLLLPPLVDIQVNGFAGVDFQGDGCTAAELERAAAGLAAAACSRFLLTLITDRWDRLLGRLRRFRGLRAASPRLQRRIAGWHLEGPFMSPVPGFHGAHPPEFMIPPTAERLRVSVIPDTIHVSPMLFRLFHRALAPERICYTTDAISAGGAGPGVFPLAGMKVEVGADGIVRQPGKANYAGSSLAPLEGVRRAATMLARSPREVWDFFSTQPAKFLGLPPALTPGAPADYCLLTEPGAGGAAKVEIHFAGEEMREVVWKS